MYQIEASGTYFVVESRPVIQQWSFVWVIISLIDQCTCTYYQNAKYVIKGVYIQSGLCYKHNRNICSIDYKRRICIENAVVPLTLRRKYMVSFGVQCFIYVGTVTHYSTTPSTRSNGGYITQITCQVALVRPWSYGPLRYVHWIGSSDKTITEHLHICINDKNIIFLKHAPNFIY